MLNGFSREASRVYYYMNPELARIGNTAELLVPSNDTVPELPFCESASRAW